LHYFTPGNLQRLLARQGFEPVRWSVLGKPLTFDYSMTQLCEYNPLIYGILRPIGRLLPQRLRDVSIPLYIGEMLMVARRR
jgi:hypothetical protein